MKQKIVARIKEKYKGINLSAKRIDAIAAKLEAKITNEDEIDAALDNVNDITPFADMARDDDRMRDLENKAKKPGAKKPETSPDDDNDETEGSAKKPADEVPEWAKGLISTVNSLATGRTQETMRSKLEKQLTDIPKSFYQRWALPEKEEDLEAFIEDVRTEYSEFKQEANNTDLSGMPKPGTGTATTPTAADKKKAEDDIKAYAALNTPKPEAAKA